VSLGQKRGIPHLIAEYLKIIIFYRVVFEQILLKISVEKTFKCLAVEGFVLKLRPKPLEIRGFII